MLCFCRRRATQQYLPWLPHREGTLIIPQAIKSLPVRRSKEPQVTRQDKWDKDRLGHTDASSMKGCSATRKVTCLYFTVSSHLSFLCHSTYRNVAYRPTKHPTYAWVRTSPPRLMDSPADAIRAPLEALFHSHQ